MFLMYDPSVEDINNELYNGSLDHKAIDLLKRDLERNTMKSKCAREIEKFVNDHSVSLEETGKPGHASWRCQVADNVFVYANKEAQLKALVFFARSLLGFDGSLKGKALNAK